MVQQEEVVNALPQQEGPWVEGAGLCDTSVGNAFRSNVEFHEKPRYHFITIIRRRT
jgi:hypothetical protein